MERKDLHTHTVFSDGQNTPAEMAAAALAAGLSVLGFSDHSYTHFDESYCMKREQLSQYRSEIAALQKRYDGRLEILCGIEQDFYSEEPAQGFDFVIGSVHYLRRRGQYIAVDEDAETLIVAAKYFFSGDIYALAEEYYRTVAQVVHKTGADIIGHFDLITKFNEQGRLFDESHPRYRAAWQAAADALLKTGKPFEINTGAVSRGFKSEPYPSAEIRDYIKAHGGSFVLSSDSHSSETLCFGFDALAALL